MTGRWHTSCAHRAPGTHTPSQCPGRSGTGSHPECCSLLSCSLRSRCAPTCACAPTPHLLLANSFILLTLAWTNACIQPCSWLQCSCSHSPFCRCVSLCICPTPLFCPPIHVDIQFLFFGLVQPSLSLQLGTNSCYQLCSMIHDCLATVE